MKNLLLIHGIGGLHRETYFKHLKKILWEYWSKCYYATIEQLLVIANMESFNAILIEQKVPQSERLVQLNNMAKSQLRVLANTNSKLFIEDKK